jgi:c-di-GMP-binding flagellar brake protein YcgR
VTGLNEIFFRRRHARASYGASLLLHDNKRVYKGQSLEVSAGGAGIIVENGSWKAGDKIYLHFKPGDDVPPFNAICEIVSKKSPSQHDKAMTYQYGVKFTSIASQTAETLNEFARARAS